jgi:murein DD-endopeptidase MepM/ murein hydrolase activator NlpD
MRKQALAIRRKRERWRKAFAGIGIAALFSVALGLYFASDYISFSDEDEDLGIFEGTGDLPADTPVYVPAIVDLAGDPMWINLERGTSTKARSIARPPELGEAGISPRIEILSDAMLSSSERFMTTIPSTQEDFAFFQAQRAAAAITADGLPADVQSQAPESPAAPALGPSAGIFADPSAGWGETIDAGEAALPGFQKTEIENNTSVAMVASETTRFATTDDAFVRILSNRSLDSVILDEHFAAEDAKLAGQALKALFNQDGLEPGYVVALRGYRPRREASTLMLMQVSVYSKDAFIGSLARSATGAFVSGVDPWVQNDLFNYSGTPDEGPLKRRYRLLDAIYSTAARNNVPTGVIGEAIMYLSRGQDLNAFATENERFVLIYSATARGKDGISGRVLYAGVHGAEKLIECFVFQQSDGEFSCITRDDHVHSLTITNGMVTPVNGVMTSTFGPRKHPILKTVRIHKGVDWMAPTGTPVFAAFDGEIAFQGDGGGYGNLVRISHGSGRETRYAHLQRFNSKMGASVKAGEVIGYVGTTGLSTGPHLHFELYEGGEAIDPLGTVSVAASDHSAVETLTDRIIQVESGGRARAKNPLSSATGLGQFIEKTWVRMMNTYRPELARSLSRQELLALRFDPTISREMVRNLAREGEAYLRTRGHQITAGRLYLSHFLGMEGAHQVLSRPSSSKLIDVLGANVISANPFLTGKDVGYVVSWAERKMRAKGKPAAQPTPITREVKQTSPEFENYKQVIAGIVESLEGAL